MGMHGTGGIFGEILEVPDVGMSGRLSPDWHKWALTAPGIPYVDAMAPEATKGAVQKSHARVIPSAGGAVCLTGFRGESGRLPGPVAGFPGIRGS